MRFRTILFAVIVLGMCILPARGQQPPATNAGEPLKLTDLLAEAERNHPSILAASRMVDAKRARVAQARALPDPQVFAGYVGDAAPFKNQKNDPASFRQFGISQEFPYPGKRDLRAQVAAKDADAENWNVETARRRVRAEVRLAFYDLVTTRKALEITEANKGLLEKLARITEEKYKVGKGLQQDLLRAQVEVTRALQRLTVLRQREHALEAQLNSLLLRPVDAPMSALAPEAKPLFAYSLDELLQRGVENAPEIRRQEQLIEQGQLAVNLAQKEFYPDFGVSWEYMNRTSGQPEMFGLRFTMNLPVFNKARRREAVTEATATQASARQMREAVRTELLFRVKEQYLQARTSEELLTLYSKALVPQSMLTLDSSLSAYQTGTLDFLSVISNLTATLDFELGYHEELASFQKALARLEEITGTDFQKQEARP